MTQLGKKVRDKITSYEGIAVSVVYHLGGGTEFGVQADHLIDGEVPEVVFFPEWRLEELPNELQIGFPSGDSDG